MGDDDLSQSNSTMSQSNSTIRTLASGDMSFSKLAKDVLKRKSSRDGSSAGAKGDVLLHRGVGPGRSRGGAGADTGTGTGAAISNVPAGAAPRSCRPFRGGRGSVRPESQVERLPKMLRGV